MPRSSKFLSWRCSPSWIVGLAFACLASAGTWQLEPGPPVDLGSVAQWVPATLPQPLEGQLEEADRLLDASHDDETLEQAGAIFLLLAQSADPLARAWGLNGQARTAQAGHARYRALALYQHAYDQFQELDDRAGQAMVLHNMGSCFLSLGDQQRAHDHYTMALDYHVSNASQAVTRIHLATLEELASAPGLAVGQLEEVLGPRLSNLAEDPRRRLHGKAVFLDRLASATSDLEPHQCWPWNCLEQAEVAYSSALQLFEAAGDYDLDVAIVRANLGSLATRGCRTGTDPCELDKALGLFDQALESPALENRDYRLALTTGKVTTLRLAGDLDAAEALADSALRTLQETSADNPPSFLRITYRDRHHPLWRERIALEVARLDPPPGAGLGRRNGGKALLLADLGRARELLERLAPQPRDGRMDSARGLSPTQAQMNDLENQRLEIGDRLKCLDAGSSKESHEHLEEAADLVQELRSLELAEQATEREEQTAEDEDDPGISSEPLTVDTLALRALQEDLGDRRTVAYYHLARERSALFWITADEVEVFELPPRSSIERKVQKLRAMLTETGLTRSEGREALRDTLSQLGEILLGPIASRLDQRQLVIVPDGILHVLPFAALVVPGDAKPAVARHELSVVPSLAVWRALQERSLERYRSRPSSPPRPWLAAVGDALYSTLDLRLNGLGIEDPLCDPPSPLPASREEVELFDRWLPDEAFRVFVEDAARREVLSAPEVRQARLVHLAVHGSLAEERPGFSYLGFSRFDTAGQPLPNSRVFTHEIDDLAFEADLMVLSACETGLGEVVRGEGLIGMGRSLLAAGVDRALITLWAVDDLATLELMRAFYQALFEEDATPVEALAIAQRALLEHPTYRDPYYWAGFVLVGDPDWPGLPPSKPSP